MSAAKPVTVYPRDPDLDRPISDLVRDLVPDIIPDAEEWMTTPNIRFGFSRPVDLVGTPREPIVRDILRAAKQGAFS